MGLQFIVNDGHGSQYSRWILLCRQFGCLRWSALIGATVFGWQPLLVSYGFSSVITDLIHLWPYAFGLAFIQRGMLEENSRRR